MTHHHLCAAPDTVRWGSFSASFPVVLTVDDGDTVTVDTVSGEPDNLPGPPFTVLDNHREILELCRRGKGPHLVTGPIAIRGASVGSVLEVRIKDVRLRSDWGWNAIKSGLGALPEDFPTASQVTVPIDIQAQRADLPWGGCVQLRPFFGIMAVAPPPRFGTISSIEPDRHGGNMDNKELVPGSILYLPVWNKDALFMVGDGHAVQGDGEVCLTALETCMSGTFEFVIRRDLAFDLPHAETPRHLITMGFHPDLNEAVRIALRAMIAWITRKTGMEAVNAYRLCSLIGDLRVTQVVDGNKGIHMMVAKEELEMAVRPEQTISSFAP